MIRSTFAEAVSALRGDVYTQRFEEELLLQLTDFVSGKDYEARGLLTHFARAVPNGVNVYKIETMMIKEAPRSGFIKQYQVIDRSPGLHTCRNFSEAEALNILRRIEDRFNNDGSLRPAMGPLGRFRHYSTMWPQPQNLQMA